MMFLRKLVIITEAYLKLGNTKKGSVESETIIDSYSDDDFTTIRYRHDRCPGHLHR